ncbi:N-acetylmuramoyl-L-alanine amidase [Nocardioides sp. W7]|uniref:N-acetylmuramoyl-L-alanine amidase n=1 Tax=Nocardioides sp. W7 TaxID=2931390 RepID=UPI001FD0FEC0|nr:N-acetylmuramoyl-L-alanine amidase [Nocardioides sp. W7]
MTDGPSAAAAEATGVRGSELLWVGASDAAQLRTTGPVPTGLDLVLIDPGTRAGDARPESAPEVRARGRAKPDRVPRPRIHSRGDWGADDRMLNGSVRYTNRLRQVHVHHTATGNGYSRADVPALIRGMYRYHTQTLGWFDLGYNFLVDRFGRAWEGRSGGPAKLVQGAHTLGFNRRSVGIAIIGSHDDNRVSDRSILTVARLAAWKLDRYDRRATGTVVVGSDGSDRYAAGRRVRLPVIDGHRDTNDTACPGERVYRRLGEIRRLAQRRISRFS